MQLVPTFATGFLECCRRGALPESSAGHEDAPREQHGEGSHVQRGQRVKSPNRSRCFGCCHRVRKSLHISTWGKVVDGVWTLLLKFLVWSMCVRLEVRGSDPSWSFCAFHSLHYSAKTGIRRQEPSATTAQTEQRYMVSGDWAFSAINAESLSFPNHNRAIAFPKAKHTGTLLYFWHTDTDLHGRLYFRNRRG